MATNVSKSVMKQKKIIESLRGNEEETAVKELLYFLCGSVNSKDRIYAGALFWIG